MPIKEIRDFKIVNAYRIGWDDKGNYLLYLGKTNTKGKVIESKTDRFLLKEEVLTGLADDIYGVLKREPKKKPEGKREWIKVISLN